MVAFCTTVAALLLLHADIAGPALLLLPLLLPLLVLDGALARAAGMAGLASLIVAVHLGAALAQRLPVAKEGEDLRLTGRVADLVTTRTDRARFLVEPASMSPWPDGAPLPRRIRLSVYGNTPAPKAGEEWTWTVRLKRPRGFSNPQRFDYEAWLASAGIHATGYVRSRPEPRKLAAGSGLVHWRAWLSERIEVAAGPGPGSAILRALIVGDRRGFDDDLWQRFRATGTSHLMAISGLHVGLAAGLGALLGRGVAACCPRVLERWPRRVIMIPPALAFAAIYAGLAGFALPTLRALVMLAVASTALLMRWRPGAGRVLLLTAVAVLLFDPWAVLSPAFWLSFGAVALLVLAFLGWRQAGRGAALRALMRAQLAIGIGLAPMTVLFFGQVSWLGIPVNLTVIPLFSLVIVPLALAGAALLAVLPSLGQWILAPLAVGLDAFAATLGWLTAFSEQLSELLPDWLAYGMPWWTLALLAALLLAGGWMVRLSAVALAMGLHLWTVVAGDRPSDGVLRLTVFEVGQGTAALVELDGRRLLYDTGPGWRGGGNAARFSVVPYLRERGVERLERVVVSHADNDHAGGLEEVMRHFEVDDLLIGEPLRDAVHGRRCRTGEAWRWGEARFRFLWPPEGADAQGNDASCVLRIDYAGRRLVLAGDIEAAAETRMLAAGIEPSDLLLVPHHGSDTSSTPAFVNALTPLVAVIPVGYGNAYGFPRASVISRYRRAGTALFRTDRDGAVITTVDSAGSLEVVSWRQASRRLFHQPGGRDAFLPGSHIHYDAVRSKTLKSGREP